MLKIVASGIELPKRILRPAFKYLNNERVQHQVNNIGEAANVFIDSNYNEIDQFSFNVDFVDEQIIKAFPDIDNIERESCVLLYFNNVDKHDDGNHKINSSIGIQKAYIMNLILQGSGEVRTHWKNSNRIRKSLQVKAGDLFILDQRIPHSFEKDVESDVVVSYNTFVVLKSMIKKELIKNFKINILKNTIKHYHNDTRTRT